MYTSNPETLVFPTSYGDTSSISYKNREITTTSILTLSTVGSQGLFPNLHATPPIKIPVYVSSSCSFDNYLTSVCNSGKL